MTSAQPNERRTSLNLDRTRQQLRELDQLLQQMLALPTDSAGGEPATAPSVPREAVQAPAELAVVEDVIAEPHIAGAPSVSVAVAAAPLPIGAEHQTQIVSLRVYAPPEPEQSPAADEAATSEPTAEAPAEVAADSTPVAGDPCSGEPSTERIPLADAAGSDVSAVDRTPLADAAGSEKTALAAEASVQRPVDRKIAEANSTTATLDRAPESLGASRGQPSDKDIHDFDLTGPVHYDLAPDHDWETLGAPAAPEGSPPYRALVEANRFFDTALRLLGPLGRPFTTSAGRSFLGWTGLLLLATAAAILVVGWLSWPEPWQILK
jgi:hypothetical protein